MFSASDKNEKTDIAEKQKNTPLADTAYKNKLLLMQIFGNSFDLMFRDIACGEALFTAAFLDGMCDRLFLSQALIRPLSDLQLRQGDNALLSLCEASFDGMEQAVLSTLEETAETLIAGSIVLFTDGECKCVAFNAPNFSKRNISEPMSEQQEKGSREGFCDFFKDNVTLLRRRLRTPLLHIERRVIGRTSNTYICICYLENRVDRELLDDVRTKLSKADPDIISGAGSLRAFLDTNGTSLFSGVGTTERPDTLASMLAQGRIGIIIDGVPFALVVPQLFIDHFHSLDDYLTRPYYAMLLRLLRIAGFFIATMLPGLFVAVSVFHPELLPANVMFDIAVSISQTPFPLVFEAIIIHFIYEIVREAGLRMPKMVGHAVSIVGALVIGDAAVSAGLIAVPMLIVIALTAISSAILQGIHEPMALLRLIFILAGGTMGLFGVALAAGSVCVTICSISPYSIPYSAPFSPFPKGVDKDLVLCNDPTKKKKNRKNNIRHFRF